MSFYQGATDGQNAATRPGIGGGEPGTYNSGDVFSSIANGGVVGVEDR